MRFASSSGSDRGWTSEPFASPRRCAPPPGSRLGGADGAAASVSYARGHDEPAGAGRSPFAGGPAVAIVAADGHAVLVAADADIDPGAVRTDGDVRELRGVRAPARRRPASRALSRRRAGGRPPSPAWAVEVGVKPATCRTGLSRAASSGRRSSCGGARRRPDDQDRRGGGGAAGRAAGSTAAGQRAARDAALAPGRPSSSCSRRSARAIDTDAGEPVALGADLPDRRVRTAEVMGGPGAPRCSRAAIPCSVISCRGLGGYWGDSSPSWTVGRPSRRLRAAVPTVAHRALEHGVETAAARDHHRRVRRGRAAA